MGGDELSEMRFIVDTHILLGWYLASPKLPKKYANLLDEAEAKKEEIGLSMSIISLWEIAKLEEHGKIRS